MLTVFGETAGHAAHFAEYRLESDPTHRAVRRARSDARLLAVGVAAILGFRFQEMPFGKIVTAEDGSAKYVWGPFSTKSSNDGFVDGWARWNFTGYEGKSAYGEYHDVVQTMKRLGEDPAHGCGRALWENNGELNKYGTTMGLMLLPFWTKGCIGSMEGLYFEAAGTTPYHFVAAAALSKQSSNPVRELRYDDNKAALGVRYLQELGVRVVIYPRLLTACAIKGMQHGMAALQDAIQSKAPIERPELLVSFEELNGLVGFDEFRELERKLAGNNGK